MERWLFTNLTLTEFCKHLFRLAEIFIILSDLSINRTCFICRSRRLQYLKPKNSMKSSWLLIRQCLSRFNLKILQIEVNNRANFKMKLFIIVTIAVFLCERSSLVSCSIGDRSMIYRDCLNRFVRENCTNSKYYHLVS